MTNATQTVLVVDPISDRRLIYVDPADEEKPKTQRATIFLELPIVG